MNPEAPSPATAIVFQASLALPTRLVLKAIELATSHGVQLPSEVHLVVVALKSQRLVRSLEAAEVDAPAVLSGMESYLNRSGRPEFAVDNAAGQLSVSFTTGVATIGSRASVLAAMTRSHAVDPIDVFVAALFDPLSLTSRELERVGGKTRVELVNFLSASLDRYTGLWLPDSRRVTLMHVARAPWALRNRAAELLRQQLPADAVWMCRRDGDDLLIRSSVEIDGVLKEGNIV